VEERGGVEEKEGEEVFFSSNVSPPLQPSPSHRSSALPNCHRERGRTLDTVALGRECGRERGSEGRGKGGSEGERGRGVFRRKSTTSTVSFPLLPSPSPTVTGKGNNCGQRLGRECGGKDEGEGGRGVFKRKSTTSTVSFPLLSNPSVGLCNKEGSTKRQLQLLDLP